MSFSEAKIIQLRPGDKLASLTHNLAATDCKSAPDRCGFCVEQNWAALGIVGVCLLTSESCLKYIVAKSNGFEFPKITSILDVLPLVK